MATQPINPPQHRLPFVFSCSGAADVGHISDLAARRLAKTKTASMCCIAAVSAGIPEILDATMKAPGKIVIDGCSKNCARTIMLNAGFDEIHHVMLEDLGMIKGESPATDDRVENVVEKAMYWLRV